MQFKDKVAIITGGSEGIGFGIAEALAKRGANVVLVARTESELQAAQQKIGEKASYFPADITNFSQMKEIIDSVHKEKGLDIFVNNAGGYIGMKIDSRFNRYHKSDRDNISYILNLDFIAPFQITHYLLQKFKSLPDRRLQVLTVLSQAAIRSDLDDGIGYGVAKKALSSAIAELDNQMKLEDVKNIQLYGLYPNSVATEKMLPLIKSGALDNPTSLESVSNSAINLLSDSIESRHARIGYYPNRGIVETHLRYEPKLHMFSIESEIPIAPHFTPTDLFK